MRIRYVSGTLGMFFTLFSNAQVVSDTIKSVDLSEVVVTGSYRHAQEKKTTLTLELFQKDYLNRHFTGNLVQTLKNVPGVHSMDIGAGFSKPMIRGLGFNRIAVSENGIKQEGQQWGADHGLEIDAFNVDEVRILKVRLHCSTAVMRWEVSSKSFLCFHKKRTDFLVRLPYWENQ